MAACALTPHHSATFLPTHPVMNCLMYCMDRHTPSFLPYHLTPPVPNTIPHLPYVCLMPSSPCVPSIPFFHLCLGHLASTFPFYTFQLPATYPSYYLPHLPPPHTAFTPPPFPSLVLWNLQFIFSRGLMPVRLEGWVGVPPCYLALCFPCPCPHPVYSSAGEGCCMPPPLPSP